VVWRVDCRGKSNSGEPIRGSCKGEGKREGCPRHGSRGGSRQEHLSPKMHIEKHKYF
jgi:hypothetical protein